MDVNNNSAISRSDSTQDVDASIAQARSRSRSSSSSVTGEGSVQRGVSRQSAGSGTVSDIFGRVPVLNAHWSAASENDDVSGPGRPGPEGWVFQMTSPEPTLNLERLSGERESSSGTATNTFRLPFADTAVGGADATNQLLADHEANSLLSLPLVEAIHVDDSSGLTMSIDSAYKANPEIAAVDLRDTVDRLTTTLSAIERNMSAEAMALLEFPAELSRMALEQSRRPEAIERLEMQKEMILQLFEGTIGTVRSDYENYTPGTYGLLDNVQINYENLAEGDRELLSNYAENYRTLQDQTRSSNYLSDELRRLDNRIDQSESSDLTADVELADTIRSSLAEFARASNAIIYRSNDGASSRFAVI